MCLAKRAVAFLAGVLILACNFPARAAEPAAPLEGSPSPARPSDDPFGYARLFREKLAAIGQITPDEFARRYPAPSFSPPPTWDPTRARFWDRWQADPATFRPTERSHPPHRWVAMDFRINPGELERLRQNGFVVSERLGALSFGDLFFWIYSRDLPVFISSDALLHAWHRSYDALLEELEDSTLTPALGRMLSGMATAVPEAQREYPDFLRPSVGDADLFLAVARSLLQGQTVPGASGSDPRLARVLAAVAAQQTDTVPLFGRVRDEDFSQFTPRGHYANPVSRGRYFRAMMWCGRTDLRVAGPKDESSARELGAALVLRDLLLRSGGVRDWRTIEAVLRGLVGPTDSMDFDQLGALLDEAGLRFPKDFPDPASLDRLQERMARSGIGRQAIGSHLYQSSPFGPDQVELPVSFTVIGQKFAPDSVSWDESLYSMWLDCLRALSVPTTDPEYPEVMRTRAWSEKTLNTQLASWTELRHDAVLYAKQSITMRAGCDYPAGYVEPRPEFWRRFRRMVERAAALVDRSSRSSSGTGRLEGAPGSDSAGTGSGVAVAGGRQVAFLHNFAQQLSTLADIAERELARKELTAEEVRFLQDVVELDGMSGPPRYSGWYPSLFYQGGADCLRPDALVADVHTDPPAEILNDPGCILEEGVGRVDLLLGVFGCGPDRTVYAGPVLSHYEFEPPADVRLTDAQWQDLLSSGAAPARPEWTGSYLVPGVPPRERR